MLENEHESHDGFSASLDCDVQLESHQDAIGQAQNEAVCSSASLPGIYQLYLSRTLSSPP